MLLSSYYIMFCVVGCLLAFICHPETAQAMNGIMRSESTCVAVDSRSTDATNTHVPGASIFVRTLGHKGHQSRPPILLVHGTSASNLYWRCIQQRLADDGLFTIAIDLRGHGQSEQTPTSDVKYTYEMFARDIASVLDSIGVTGQFDWAGVSIGSSIAVEFNALFPGRIRRMALFSYNPLFAQPGCTKYGCILGASSTPQSMLNEPCQDDPLLIEAQDAIAQNKQRAGPIIPNLIHNGWTQDQGDQLALIKVPTLVGFGTVDSLLGDGNSTRYVYHAIENSVMREHVAKGHLFLISDERQAYKNIVSLLFEADEHPISDQAISLNTGCHVCPLVRPVENFTPCPLFSQNTLDD